MAAPFVQGRLRSERVEVLVVTECARTRRSLHIEIDSDLKFRVREQDARPLIFAPLKVVQPGAANIIDGF